jgi:hypothetical protein
MTEKEYAFYSKSYLDYFRQNWSDARLIREAWALANKNLLVCKTEDEKQRVFVESLCQAITNEVFRGFSVRESDLPTFEQVKKALDGKLAKVGA